MLIDEGLDFTIWEQILTGKLTFAQVAKDKGIKFSIYPKEEGHNEPHCHVEYQGNNISISLISFTVLAGNIPPQRQKMAIDWVKRNIQTLMKCWNTYHSEMVA